MADGTLVSLIVPNFNHAAYLPALLESLIRQTHPELELILVDDGSTDASVAELRRHLPPLRRRMRDTLLLELGRNRGKIGALNAAIPLARGEVTILMDADDILTPDYVARTVGILAERRRLDPKVGFVYTDCVLIDSAGAEIGVGRSCRFDAAFLREASYIPDCGPTLTAALRAILPMDETVRVGTKHQKWQRIVSAGYVGWHVPEPLFFYRMHDGNLSGIGARVLSDIRSGQRRERILAGYWPTEGERRPDAGP